MNKTIQEHYVRRAGGLYKGTRADQPAAGGLAGGLVVFLHTPAGVNADLTPSTGCPVGYACR